MFPTPSPWIRSWLSYHKYSNPKASLVIWRRIYLISLDTANYIYLTSIWNISIYLSGKGSSRRTCLMFWSFELHFHSNSSSLGIKANYNRRGLIVSIIWDANVNDLSLPWNPRLRPWNKIEFEVKLVSNVELKGYILGTFVCIYVNSRMREYNTGENIIIIIRLPKHHGLYFLVGNIFPSR